MSAASDQYEGIVFTMADESILLKRCSRKKQCVNPNGPWLPATTEYFYRQPKGRYGLMPECKECRHVRTVAYNLSHRAERSAHSAAYNAAHREENRARRIAYLATPHGKEIHKAQEQRRRAHKAQSEGNVTTEEYAEVLKAHTNKKQQVICAWCGRPIEKEWHFDHWIPLSEGGKHEAGNIRVMHGKNGDRCNLVKGAKLPFEFGKLI